MSPDPHFPKLLPSQHALHGNSAAVTKVSRSGLTLSRLLRVQNVSAFLQAVQQHLHLHHAFVAESSGHIIPQCVLEDAEPTSRPPTSRLVCCNSTASTICISGLPIDCERSELLRLKGEMPEQTSTKCICMLSVEF